jgi:PAS domain S-box-containing protein
MQQPDDKQQTGLSTDQNYIHNLNEELAASNEELRANNEELTAIQGQLESSLEIISEREEQIRALVESAPFPIAVYLGKEMRIAQANKAVIDVWGKGDDVLGKTYHELLPELKEQNIYQQLDAVYDTGIPFHIRNQQVNLVVDGQLKEFYFNYSFTPLLDKTGIVYGIMNTAADVTDLNLANKQIEFSEQNLRKLAEKQASLAAIINSSDDIIISKTLNGIITSWNPAAERLFGYSEQEAVGCHISMIIPADRIQEEDYIISQIRNGKKVDHFDTVRVNKNGKELQLSLTISPVTDDNGVIIGASKIGRDISAQVAAQQSARKYTERLEIMNMVMGTIAEELDLNKILQKVTDATTDLTGAQFGAFFYNNIDDQGESYMLYTLSGAPREAFAKFGMPRNTAVFHPTFSGQTVVRSDDITKDPRYGQNEPHFGMPKGHLPVVSYLAVPVTSLSGTVIGGLFFGHSDAGKFTYEHETLVSSIAAQAAISIDNAKLFEEVKALNDKKDEFIGLASHELKTPLASINGYLQILGRQIRDSQHTKFLDKASQQVSKLTSLVNDLLDVSKIEAGKLKLTTADFDIREITAEAIELIQHSTAKHSINFRSNVEQCIITGDAQRVEQVIINLLSNAIKYSPAANLVEVDLLATEENVVLSVKDFGFGIEQEKINHIFTRFYRIDEATPNISGLGIGLYISNEIISRHSGRIWVESEVGKGSIFYFLLPKT